MTFPIKSRVGFTLIEMLVVVGIIAALAALLLPAVQSAREAANRASCANKLMQLSTALANYHSTYETLPPGVIDWKSPVENTPGGYRHGWVTQILPYLECQNVERRLDRSVGIHDPANDTATNVVLDVLICPSNRFPAGSKAAAGINPAKSNFAGCYNDTEAPIAADGTGVLYLNSLVRFSDVTDGLATTLFLGEKLVSPGELGWASGTRSTLRNTGTTAFRTLARGPIGPEPPQNLGPVGGFSSKHETGFNAAFGDGSVRFLRPSIDPAVFRHLGNRADGELVSADRF